MKPVDIIIVLVIVAILAIAGRAGEQLIRKTGQRVDTVLTLVSGEG